MGKWQIDPISAELMRGVWSLTLMIALVLTSASPAVARSKGFGAQPGAGLPQFSPNASYLANQAYGLERERDSLSARGGALVDRQTMSELRARYSDLARSYEARSQAGIQTLGEKLQHRDQMAGFSREVFMQVQRQQARTQTRVLRDSLKDMDQGLHSAAAVVAGGMAAFAGAPLRMRFSSDTSMQARAFGASRRGEISFNSPLIQGRVDVATRDPRTVDQIAQDPTQQFDRARLSVWRTLPVWDLATSVSYGMSSSTVTASITKPITQHISAVVDTTRSLSGNLAPGAIAQDSVKVFYNFRF